MKSGFILRPASGFGALGRFPTPRPHSMWVGRPSPYLGCSKHFFRHSGLRRILSETKVVLAPLQEEDASSRHLSRHGGRILCHPQICPPPSSCRYNVSTALHNPKEFHFLRARPGRIRRPALSAAVAAYGRFSNGRKRASKEVPNYPEWFRYGRPQLTGTASGSSRSQARLDRTLLQALAYHLRTQCAIPVTSLVHVRNRPIPSHGHYFSAYGRLWDGQQAFLQPHQGTGFFSHQSTQPDAILFKPH